MRRGVLFAFVGVVITGSLVAAFVLFRNKDAADGQPVAAVAGDTPKEEFPKATGPHEPYPFKRVVLVSIGINHYPKLRGTTDLRFAAADAAEVAEVCETLFGYEVVRLSGEKATRQEIESTLKRYGEVLGNEDALVVYFAGHGQVVPISSESEAGFLIPADADLDINDKSDPARWASQALDMQFVADILQGMKARHVVLIADACCSGFLIRRGTLERADLRTFLLGEKSRSILTATTRYQSAREDAAAKHGFFTAALLQELRKDDAASVLDLHLPVMKSVSAKTNGAMTPQFGQIGTGDGLFVFVPKSIPRSQLEADLSGRSLGEASPRGLSGVQARSRERAGAKTTFADLVEAFEAPDYRFSADPDGNAKRCEARFSRYQVNATLGDPWAMGALSICFTRGLGTEKSPERALHWAKQADRIKSPAGVGRFLLGRCYETGTGVVANPVAEEKLVNESAAADFPLALLARGERRTADRAAAEKDLVRAFDAGVTSASVPLARFAFGEKSPKREDVATAVKRLEAAAAKGVPAADHELWAVYLGKGEAFPERNLEKAKSHLLRAAEAGHAVAQRELAVEHYQNTSEFFTTRTKADWPEDFEKASKWATLAAAQGEPGAHHLLAELHRHGKGVSPDHEKYRTHLDAAARGKWPAAMSEQFWELCRGKLLEQNFAQALKTAEQSAGLGHAEGHYNLGYYYLAILDAETKKTSLREGVETFLNNDHENTYRTVHHYWQAYKIAKHPGAKRFLESYWKTHVDKRGSLAVDDDLEKHFPETAKELFAAPDFEKKG
jgi:TPR repeat protein